MYKLSQSNDVLIISNTHQTFELRKGIVLIAQITRLCAEIFQTKKSVEVNRSILLGLIYDDALHDETSITIAHRYFYKGDAMQKIAEELGLSSARCKYRFDRLILFLRKHRDLLLMENERYSDLLVSYLGKPALRTNYVKANSLMSLRPEKFIDTIIALLPEEKLSFWTTLKVIRLAATRYEIDRIAIYESPNPASKDKVLNLVILDGSVPKGLAFFGMLDTLEKITGKRVILHAEQYFKHERDKKFFEDHIKRTMIEIV